MFAEELDELLEVEDKLEEELEIELEEFLGEFGFPDGELEGFIEQEYIKADKEKGNKIFSNNFLTKLIYMKKENIL